MRFAKWVFLVAGVSGILLVVPPYFLENKTSAADPPITHPEYYYGFLGVTLAWQLLYLLIASDPARFRPAMPLGALGKASFAVAIGVLYLAGRVSPRWLGFASLDAAWVVLFLVAYLRTPKERMPPDDVARLSQPWHVAGRA
ncbi:MAG: hypothetical protein L0191_10570 [Acidobacteria bacterium]|nr:hypothetical protein [Acidobacteriota bacterium]